MDGELELMFICKDRYQIIDSSTIICHGICIDDNKIFYKDDKEQKE
jgi:hypothetical protein